MSGRRRIDNQKMVKSKLFIVLIFLIAGCNQLDRKKVTAVYDEAALKKIVLATTDTNKAKSIIVLDAVLTAASKDSAVFFQTVAYLEQPFGNPNSAYRNEDLYAAVLQAKMKSEWVDSVTIAKTREKLYLLMQNRVGAFANDFRYETPTGYGKNMYAVQANHLLLYFNNPDCDACKQMKAALARSSVIAQNIKEGNLKVLSIYPDKDEKRWLDHLSEYPPDWLQGWVAEGDLHQNKVYDLRAIPTIYLLDKNKKVVLKDCMLVEAIERVLLYNSDKY